MKYELIDLGKPHELVLATAFIVTPHGSYMIKGGRSVVLLHLKTINKFFGKIVYKLPKTIRNRTYSINYISGGFRIKVNSGRHVKRKSLEIIDSTHNLVLLKVRRLPEKWPLQLNLDVTSQILVAADHLEEYGFPVPAQLLRNSATMQSYRNHFID
jgi:hypothetical protein